MLPSCKEHIAELPYLNGEDGGHNGRGGQLLQSEDDFDGVLVKRTIDFSCNDYRWSQGDSAEDIDSQIATKMISDKLGSEGLFF